ncbi:MAG: hypothetical protein EX260_12085 [Desulfobulbaceae bacterium]|nr:MAG: hypothetical protein EX260_12085 [Desulfobulbaceae bacterium]
MVLTSRKFGVASGPAEHHSPGHGEAIHVAVVAGIAAANCITETQALPGIDWHTQAYPEVPQSAVVGQANAGNGGLAAVTVTTGETGPQTGFECVNDVTLNEPKGVLFANSTLQEVIVVAEQEHGPGQLELPFVPLMQHRE